MCIRDSGFSNGANIAAAMLMQRPDILAGATLLRAMVPFVEPPRADLTGKPILILSGALDPIVPKTDAEALACRLSGSGATVEHRVLPAGHGLGQADIGLLKDWLAHRSGIAASRRSFCAAASCEHNGLCRRPLVDPWDQLSLISPSMCSRATG